MNFGDISLEDLHCYTDESSYKVVKVDKNGTQYVEGTCNCSRCGGDGGWSGWTHTGYTCWKCGGSGKETFKARILTEQYRAKLEADRVRRIKKQEMQKNKEHEELASASGFSYSLPEWFCKKNDIEVNSKVVAYIRETEKAVLGLIKGESYREAWIPKNIIIK